MILATGAYCELTLLDGKQVELAVWRHLADTFVGPNLAEAIDVLKGPQDEMERRYAFLLDAAAARSSWPIT